MVQLSVILTVPNLRNCLSKRLLARNSSTRFKCRPILVANMVKQLPCIPTGCSACCRETTMPLTEAEAKRLSRRTGMALESFTWENNGILTLLNDEKTRACVFLLTLSPDVHAEGICSVYDVRPEGCRKYPVVLNSDDQAILDKGCPHRQEFPQPSESDAIELLNLEERLLRKR